MKGTCFIRFFNVYNTSFKSIKNKHDVCRRKVCIKNFIESLIEHIMDLTNIKKKKNKVINKRSAETISKCKNLSYLSS